MVLQCRSGLSVIDCGHVPALKGVLMEPGATPGGHGLEWYRCDLCVQW